MDLSSTYMVHNVYQSSKNKLKVTVIDQPFKKRMRFIIIMQMQLQTNQKTNMKKAQHTECH